MDGRASKAGFRVIDPGGTQKEARQHLDTLIAALPAGAAGVGELRFHCGNF
jgi:hypothetical protein